MAEAVAEEGKCCRPRVRAAHTVSIGPISAGALGRFQLPSQICENGRLSSTDAGIYTVTMKEFTLLAAAAAVKADVRLERRAGGSVGTSESHLAEFSAGENNNSFDCFAFSALKCS